MAIQKLSRGVNRPERGKSGVRVLAIDPGFGRCGIALFEGSHLLESECIETDPKADFSARLLSVVRAAETYIDRFSPETLVLETLFFASNQKTAMQVAETRGALIYLAASRGMHIVEYAPRQVKQAVTGNGAADKRAIARMVEQLVIMPKKKKIRDDEYDAIALGIAYGALGHVRG